MGKGFELTREISMIPGAAISQYRFVKVDTTAYRCIQGTAGADAIGVSRESAAAAGDPAIPITILDEVRKLRIRVRSAG